MRLRPSLHPHFSSSARVFSLVSAVCLVIGLPALYVGRHEHLGRVGVLAYVVALVGTVFLAAQEWAEIFLIHDIALHNPGTLAALEGGAPPTPYDVSAMAAFGAFSIGWLLLSATIIVTRALPRWIGILVIAGFFAAPLLAGLFQATLQQPALGAAIGNAILGMLDCHGYRGSQAVKITRARGVNRGPMSSLGDNEPKRSHHYRRQYWIGWPSVRKMLGGASVI